MARIAIPEDLADMFAACEDAYEQATREGYAENPAVVAAVHALKSAWTALHIANRNVPTKGFFAVEFAAVRAERACAASRQACINLQAAIKEAAAEYRLFNRSLMVANRPMPGADKVGDDAIKVEQDAIKAEQNDRLRLLA
jgi:hypothetical protein